MARRRRLAAALTGSAVLVAPVALASNVVAYVNYPLLLKEAPQTQASMTLLQQEFSDQRARIEKDEADLKRSRAKFLSLGPEVNQLERASVAEQLKKARQTLQEDRQSYQTGFSLRRDQLIASLKKLLHKEIGSYARMHGLSVVLESQTVFAAPTVDITDAILARLKVDYQAAQKQGHQKN